MTVRSFRQLAAPMPGRWPRAAELAVDCAVAAVLALFGVIGVGQAHPATMPASVGEVLALVCAAGVAVRRLAPAPVLAVVLAASAVSYQLGFGKDPMIAVALVLYLVATTAPAGPAVAALAVTEAGVVVTWHSPAYVPNLLPRIAATAFLQGAAWALGFAVRAQRGYAAGLREQAERQVQAEAERSRRALAEERLRIARELHDMVAHTMGVIAVQAGAAGHVAATQPVQAGLALRAIEETSRSALHELRRMLTVLRDGGTAGPGRTASPGGPDAGGTPDAAGLAPAPGLGDLPGLVERTRATGLRVELAQTGEPGDVEAGTGLAAFRIVQEALANVVRHARADRVRVLLEHGPAGLRVTVTDNGTAVPGKPAPPEGHGLLGMRERAALCGGDFAAGPRPAGGYQVRAFLPAVPAAGGAAPDPS